LRHKRIALAALLFAAAFCSGQSAPSLQAETANPANPPAASTATAGAQTVSQQTPPATPAAGQQSPAADPGQGQSPSKESPSKEAPDAKAATPADATSKDRLFFALPNFLTLENAGHVPPMTAGEKFKVVARSSFDPVQIVWYGFLSGISQAENSEPGYRQGAEGYGKRYGAYAADGTIENFMVGAVLPSIFRQDPRYFQSGNGSFAHRVGYSVSRIAVTRTDSGHQQFNFSEIFGSALASAISTYSYHPGRTLIGMSSNGTPVYTPSDRTLKNTASVWGTQVGYDTITLVIKEFWPDIRRKMKKQPH